tara:strand:- start:113 stop:595 length:483 start_codon:yes stop_codon:yes gene_type:complete
MAALIATRSLFGFNREYLPATNHFKNLDEARYHQHYVKFTKEYLENCDLTETANLENLLETMIYAIPSDLNEQFINSNLPIFKIRAEKLKECIHNWYERVGNLLFSYRRCPFENINQKVRTLFQSREDLQKFLTNDMGLKYNLTCSFAEEEITFIHFCDK